MMKLPPDDQQPNSARIYDYLLGGHHNFEVDRQAAARVIELNPDARHIAQCNRAFVQRVVRFCLDHGIDQFLDVGAGMPTTGNTHDIAHQRNPYAHVIYVDNDSLVNIYGAHLLRGTPTTAIIHADMRHTNSIVYHPTVQRLLDWKSPILLLATSVLPFVIDDGEATEAIQRLIATLPLGSYVALSHPIDDMVTLSQPEQFIQHTKRIHRRRTQAAIEAFFTGTELVEPGVVYLPLWHPEGTSDIFLNEPERARIVGGVGQKRE